MGSLSTRALTVAAVAGAVAALVVTAAPGVSRSGYLLDEELTTFAVQGIVRHGLPTLPSGALYARGLPYSYVAAGAGQILGYGLPAYRLVSLVLGALAIVVMFAAARAADRNAITGIAACWLIALYPGMAIASSWARFYSFACGDGRGCRCLFSQRIRHGRPHFGAAVDCVAGSRGGILLFAPAVPRVSRLASTRGRQTIVPAIFAVLTGQLLLIALNFAARISTPINGSPSRPYRQ